MRQEADDERSELEATLGAVRDELTTARAEAARAERALGAEREKLQQLQLAPSSDAASLAPPPPPATPVNGGARAERPASHSAEGGASMVALEQLRALAARRADELECAREALRRAEETRDALAAEATLLGRRNADLEALAAGAPALAQRAAELQRRHDVLLELLGEKAEEHEQVQRDAQADVADVRGLYQQQVADLTTKVLDLKGGPDS